MSRTAGRNAEETRLLILDAAARLIGRRGTSVPVADIAEAAGVSKGGVLYHFPSKQALLHGLVVWLIDEFRRDVEDAAEVEPDGTPGRIARGYIRASFAHAEDVTGLRDCIALAAHFMFEPELEALQQREAERWREQLLADGLPPHTAMLISAACDGSYSSPLWGAILTDADRDRLKADLIALTQP